MNPYAITRLLMAIAMLWSLPAYAGNYDKLNHLPGFNTTTYYSEGAAAQAETLTGRCDRVITFYRNFFRFEPEVTLLVLSPADWIDHTDFPVYGMPHYTSNSTLIVASEDNDMWRSFLMPLEQLPPDLASQVRKTYTSSDGQLSMRAFFDLLAIHELGHAYHFQAGLNMQRHWLMEVFVNIFLHTYIAEQEPDLLPALTIFPQMVVASTEKAALPFTTLNELEHNYELIGMQYPNNYGWYQCRWHIAAGKAYDEGGTDALKKLWFALKDQEEFLDDQALVEFLSEKVHKSLAEIPLKWDE